MRWMMLIAAIAAPVASFGSEYWDGPSSPYYASVEHDAIGERLSEGDYVFAYYPDKGPRIAVATFYGRFISHSSQNRTLELKLFSFTTKPRRDNGLKPIAHPSLRAFKPSMGGSLPEYDSVVDLPLKGARIFTLTYSDPELKRKGEVYTARNALGSDMTAIFDSIPWSLRWHHPVEPKLDVEQQVARRHERARRLQSLGFSQLAEVAHLQATRYWVDAQWYPQSHKGDSKWPQPKPHPIDAEGTRQALADATTPRVFERIDKALAEAGIEAAVRRLVTRYYDSPEWATRFDVQNGMSWHMAANGRGSADGEAALDQVVAAGLAVVRSACARPAIAHLRAHDNSDEALKAVRQASRRCLEWARQGDRALPISGSWLTWSSALDEATRARLEALKRAAASN